MTRIRALLAAVLAALATATASPVPAAASPPVQRIDWHPCGERPGAECGTLAVPLDWEHPRDGRTVTLYVSRRAAANPEQRIGALFYNPGGPGTGAAGYVRDYDTYTFSKALRERFDLIGVDPRGVAGSGQLHCGLPVHDPAVSEFPRDRAGYDALVAHNRAVGESCPVLARYMDTDSVARDLDAVRAALGEERIGYLGASYGTMLGTAYAQLFPHRVARMVLDGVVDRGAPAGRLVAAATAAVEDAFARFAAWCDADEACALHGRDVPAFFRALAARAESGPLPVPGGGRALTAEELRYTVYVLLNLLPEYRTQLADALKSADAGDPSFLAAIRTEALDAPDSTAAYRAVLCRDVDPGLHGYGDYRARLDRTLRDAPNLAGTSEFWDMTTGCLGWPHPPLPRRPVSVTGTPPMLLVGTTHDPATPWTWANALSERIEGSRLLTVDGDGHTAYGRSACASAAIDAYLTAGVLPAAGTVCAGA